MANGPIASKAPPNTAPDFLPEFQFVARATEFDPLLGELLCTARQKPVAMALHGAGGFGKTTLAIALCHHAQVVARFKDGIFWVTLGEHPDVRSKLGELYFDLTGEPQAFNDDERLVQAIAKQLSAGCRLLVLDDVWLQKELRPFLRAAQGCAFLFTTRNLDLAVQTQARATAVDRMKADEAVQMLGAGICPAPSQEKSALRAIATLLGHWPLLLELANAALRRQIALGDTLDRGLEYLRTAYERKGSTAFDPSDAEARNDAIQKSVEVSLDLLSNSERDRFTQVAIFHEDIDIPLPEVNYLWSIGEFAVKEELEKLHFLSLLKLDLSRGACRLHDVLRTYLLGKLADAAAVHLGLVEAWDGLPKLNSYSWRWIAYHMVKADRKDDLRRLLLNFDYLQAKLAATDPNALIADYDYLSDNADLRLLQSAIRLSANVLARDAQELAGQLTGRLLGNKTPSIEVLLKQAAGGKAWPWFRPLNCSLTMPGGPLIRTLEGHMDRVRAVAVTPDGRRVVSASDDRTLRLDRKSVV